MNEELQRANILYEQERWGGALELYQAYLAENPEHIDALCRAAQCLLELEIYGQASEYAAAAIAAAPDDDHAYAVQAHIFYARNLYEDARRSIEIALELQPTHPDHRVMLGRLHTVKSSWKEALEAADAALELDPMHAGALILKAGALIKLRKTSEASQCLEVVLEKDPENEGALVQLGYLYLHDGLWKEAMERFQEALMINPESEAARDGFMEALRAQYPLYGLMLRYSLWLQKFSHQHQQAIQYGASVLARLLSHIRKSHPALAPILGFILLLWRIFAYLSWTIKSATTILLRLNEFGRRLVTQREVVESNIVGVLWTAAAACALWHNLVDPFTLFCRIGIPVFLTLPLVVGGCFATPDYGWPKVVSQVILVVMLVSGVAGLFLYSWTVPIGLTLLRFYFTALQFVLLGLAWLESVEPEKK